MSNVNSRLIDALRVMASDPSEISELIKAGDDYYFVFKGRAWSITKTSDDGFYVFFYPDRTPNLKLIAERSAEGDESLDFLTFKQFEFQPRDRAAFTSLYDAVSAKHFGLDSVLDDILGKEDPIPF